MVYVILPEVLSYVNAGLKHEGFFPQSKIHLGELFLCKLELVWLA